MNSLFKSSNTDSTSNNSTSNTILTIQKVIEYQSAPQRSEEWFEQRRQHLTSSDLGTVLGLNKYKTCATLFHEKCSKSENKTMSDSKAIQHGVFYENEAIQMYCKLLGRKNYEIGLVPYDTFNVSYNHNEMDLSFLAGSVDGVTIGNTPNSINVIEVKCPYRRKIKMGEIPLNYYPQLQMNIHILNVQFGDFVEYVPIGTQGNSEPLMNIVRIYRDDRWLTYVYPTLRTFWNNVIEQRKNSCFSNI